MLLRVDVLHAAWKALPPLAEGRRRRTILLSPQGRVLTQGVAKELASEWAAGDELVLVCGHYEGVDERFIELCVDEELSIGDYVLTGGEPAALVVADTVMRLLPGVVGNAESVSSDSLEGGVLKYPQYTRPRDYEGHMVPDILLSGDHRKISEWRADQARTRTARKRPDLTRS